MANHPNRKQYPLRLSAPERDALLEVLDMVIARLMARGRNPTVLRRVREKVEALGRDTGD